MDYIRETALRHAKSNITTWLRPTTYQELLKKAKEHTVDSCGNETIITENAKYVLKEGKLYSGYFVVSTRFLVSIDSKSLPEKGELHELL